MIEAFDAIEKTDFPDDVKDKMNDFLEMGYYKSPAEEQELANSLVSPTNLGDNFMAALKSGKMPDDWKRANT